MRATNEERHHIGFQYDISADASIRTSTLPGKGSGHAYVAAKPSCMLPSITVFYDDVCAALWTAAHRKTILYSRTSESPDASIFRYAIMSSP
jgi:hypothetical protein